MKAYLQSILFKLFDWITGTNAWKSFFKAIGEYNLRFKGYPLFPTSDYFKIVDTLENGKHYVFVATDTECVSSILIKEAVKISKGTSYFSHAGHIFYGENRTVKILHMRSIGLIEQLALDFLKQVDYFCVIEIPVKKGCETEVENRINEVRKNAKNISYDWAEELTNGDNLIYCSELIYDNFKDLVDNPNFVPRLMYGRLIFDPDNLLNCGKIVYSNHPNISCN